MTPITALGSRYGIQGALGRSVKRAAVSTFPVIEEVTLSQISTADTSHLISMPSTVNAGDLLLILFSGKELPTNPSGWTQLISKSYIGANLFISEKVAVGNEDDTTVDLVTANADVAVAYVYRIRSGTWGGAVTDVEVATAQAKNATANPPSLTASWGAGNNLWMAGHAAGRGEATASTYPSDFSDGRTNHPGEALSTYTAISSATREYADNATLDPSTFTIGYWTGWVAFTLVIKPA